MSALSEQTQGLTSAQVLAAAQSLGFMTPQQVQDTIAAATAQFQTATQVAAAVQTQAPSAVLPLIPPPLFRFSVPGSLVGLGIIHGAIADRAGTLASMQVRCSALTSAGALTFSLKKNGTTIKTWNGSTSTQVLDLTTTPTTIAAGDLLTIEVTAFTLVVGLGVTYGFIKAS